MNNPDSYNKPTPQKPSRLATDDRQKIPHPLMEPLVYGDEVEAVVEAGEGFAVPASQELARPTSTSNRGRFLPNLISNAALFGFNILVGLWYTPYLIDHLGTAAYGIIPLVTQITNYMIVVTATLNSATGRYITIALEQNNDEEANQYFNTSLFGSMLLVLLLIPLTVWATVNIGSIITLPEGQESQARWLFTCTVSGFFLGTLQSPFGVSCFCRNRFDLQNTISLIQAIVRVGLVVVLFSVVKPQIWQVGLAALVAMLFGWGWSVRLWRKLTPSLRVSLSHFKLATLNRLFSFGGWVAINHIGTILYVSIDLLVVNRMFGSESAGRYAAVLQWSILLRTLAGAIFGVFGPTMLRYYAQNDINGLCRYACQAVKFMGILMALPIGVICGFSIPLLQTWLGPEFVDLTWLMTLMTVHLSVTIATYPLFGIQQAANRVRLPAIVTLLMGAGNLGLAIFLAGPMGWGLYGIAAAGAIALIAKNLVFTPLYNAHILDCRIDTFLWEILPIILLTLGTTTVCKVLASTWDIAGWLHLMAAGIGVSIIYAAVGYFVILNREERTLAWSMVPFIGSYRK